MKSNLHFFKRLYNAWIDALFPVKCLVCDCFFEPAGFSPGSNVSGQLTGSRNSRDHRCVSIEQLFSPFVCAVCAATISLVEGPICLSCGIMFKSSEGDNRICGDCITAPKQFRIARAPAVYDQAMMHLIHCFKYNAKIQLTKPFSGLLLATLNHYWEPDSFDVVMPIPLSANRIRQRGFNQAYLLICGWRKIADQLGMDLPKAMISKDALIRNRTTLPQTGLGRKARMQNIENAFSIDKHTKIREKRILLVDDVYTTGATVNECARELMDNGARSVDVLTVARAM
jgi:ComF family protein